MFGFLLLSLPLTWVLRSRIVWTFSKVKTPMYKIQKKNTHVLLFRD